MSDHDQGAPNKGLHEFSFGSGRLEAAIQRVQGAGLSYEKLVLCVAGHMLTQDDLNRDLERTRQELKETLSEQIKVLKRITVEFDELAKTLPDAIAEQVTPLLGQLRSKWLAEQRTTTAKKAAAAKLQNDDKQKAKEQIKAIWLEYQAGRATFKSGADFARHAVEKCPSITSVKSVERWVTEWRKERKNTR